MLLGSSGIAQNDSPPNVIVIYTDDQGAVDLGSYGAKDIFSPNLDRLAQEGTRFTQSYVAAPVCAPSRAALLTGNYPQNAGVPSNTSARIGSDGMPNDQYTLAELFKDNGYRTGHIGKWHLGMSKETQPNAQGFDYSFGHLRGCIDNYSHYFYWEGPNIHDLHENGKEVFYPGQYFPDLASDKALAFVEDNKDASFFMYYAINMPHYPYQPTQKWREHYKEMEQPRADYAAFISTIDERIGFLLNKLDELELRENTIIIYQSDNGYSTEVRAFGGGGSSGPYRGAKSSLFEGGIRLPTIISWKGTLPEEAVNDKFILNTDWMPTLIKLCRLKKGNDQIDGIDQSPMIIDPTKRSNRDQAFWKYGSQWAVRMGAWKLIAYPKDTSHKGELSMETDALFLSDLSKDVSEMNNIASQHPEVVEKMVELYSNWEHGDLSQVPQKLQPIDHLGVRATISSNRPLHGKYKNIDVLIDGKRGIPSYDSGEWIGHENKPLEFIIDLQNVQSIKQVAIGYLRSPGNWIFKPGAIQVGLSNDGKSYTTPTSKQLSSEDTNLKTETGLMSLNLSGKARYIKVSINGIGKCPPSYPCSGGDAWVFIDEIIIN